MIPSQFTSKNILNSSVRYQNGIVYRTSEGEVIYYGNFKNNPHPPSPLLGKQNLQIPICPSGTNIIENGLKCGSPVTPETEIKKVEPPQESQKQIATIGSLLAIMFALKG